MLARFRWHARCIRAAATGNEERNMMQRASILCLLSAIATACSTSSKPDATNTQNAVEPAPNPFPDAPPNSPPPAATCGDMNGGGDQHVDFPGLLAAKIAEKTEAE